MSKLKAQKSKVEDWAIELSMAKHQLARTLADYDNLRKRTEAEKELWASFSAEKVLIKLIPVLDMLESAQKHTQDSGLAIAIGEFRKIFAEEGIEEIVPKPGDIFDPELNEAVESVSGGKKGHVSEVLLSGWRFLGEKGLPAGRQVIRPAKVKVYGEKTSKEEELEKEALRGDYV